MAAGPSAEPQAATDDTPARRVPAAAFAVGIRRAAARGTIINAGFQVALACLLLARRLIVAAFLTRAEFGVWGVLLMVVMTVVFLKDVGIADRYVQQSEADQQRAFQKAFTVEFILGGTAMLIAMAAVLPFVHVYGHPELLLPGLLLCTVFIGTSLQAPAWVFYREMNFVRQRTITMVDPIVAFIVTVGLAVAGAGYWSLVVGAVVGSFSGGAVALMACPYAIRFRLERGTLRDYFNFSWPIALASGGGVVVGQTTTIVASRSLGLGALGSIGLAGTITAFSDGVDGIVTNTIYPAICAVRDRSDLLYEAFVKSNRLALMWGVPFGVSVALFASDLVDHVIGERWQPTVVVLQAAGLVASLNQVGFNLPAFLRAVNRTRPIAVLAGVNVAAFLLFPAPGLLIDGLRGFALGLLAANIITLAARTVMLRRMFPAFRLLPYAGRAFAPVIPAAGVVLLLRAMIESSSAAMAAIEFVTFWVVAVALTLLLERRLLREMAGYLLARTQTPSR